MSFVALKSLLPKAISRIDKKDTIRRNIRGQKTIALCKSHLGVDDIEYKNGLIIIYGLSPSRRQKIFFSKNKIISYITKELVDVEIDDIVFKGPR